MRSKFLAVTFVLLAGLNANAQYGQLDPTFGDGGVLPWDVPEMEFVGTKELWVLPDGKLLVSGTAQSTATGFVIPVVMRRFPDGNADPAFGNNGVFSYAFPQDAGLSGSAVLDDGRILIMGSTTPGVTQTFFLMRLLENGVPDPSFGDGGPVLIDMENEVDRPLRMRVAADGSIIIVGQARNTGQEHKGEFIRLTPEGDLDTTLNGTGYAYFPQFLEITDLRALNGGAILVCGHSQSDHLSARITATGELDMTYGDAGISAFPFWGGGSTPVRIALTNDGGVVMTSRYDPPQEAVLYKADPNGSLVPSFGNSGMVLETDPSDEDEFYYDVLIQGDDKIIVTGHAEIDPGGYPYFITKRFLVDGTLDPTFGVGGVSRVDIPEAGPLADDDYAKSCALGANGKLYVLGTAAGYTSFALVRYNMDPDIGVDEVPVQGQGKLSCGSSANMIWVDQDVNALGQQFMISDIAGRGIDWNRTLNSFGQTVIHPRGDLASGVYVIRSSGPNGVAACKVFVPR